MSYKDILVYLDAGPFLESRLEAAVALARRHGARLTGVDVSTEAAFEGEWRPRVEALQETFETQARRAALEFQFRTADRQPIGNLHAHYADLFVATQSHKDTEHLALAGVPEQVLLNAGAPGLILPCWWQPKPLGRSVVVAWNATREATRAVHDALPILRMAEKVVVFAFEPNYEAKNADVTAIVAHLARHGVKTSVDGWSDTGEISAVDALFSTLDTADADLIVAGAFGHSRWLEGLFGGVSRDLLGQESMAVLMSH